MKCTTRVDLGWWYFDLAKTTLFLIDIFSDGKYSKDNRKKHCADVTESGE